MEGAGEKRERDARRVDSLGWLTESAVMPKKQRAIQGVGPSSIVELRAQLYRTHEDVKRAKELGVDPDVFRPKKKLDAFLKKNFGVEDRATRDKLHLKATKDGVDSYAALEKKAELYDKLVRGELPDEEEKEKYSVDFLRKGSLDDEAQEMERDRLGDSRHDGRENFETAAVFDGGTSDEKPKSGVGWGLGKSTGLSLEQKQLIREVNVETKEARGKAVELKQRRQMLAEKNREKLRLAFLKKQVEKLKSSGGLQEETTAPKARQEQAT
ncbi:hypothetical protein M758_3G059000 [Ceratodon purpureus]|nr:hypothetical protein M758_3G059000 [Ceratodon purpureus]